MGQIWQGLCWGWHVIAKISYFIVSAQSFWTLRSINYLKLKLKHWFLLLIKSPAITTDSINCWCHNKPKSSIFWISLYSLQNKKTFQNILDIRYKLGCYWSIHKGWHQAQCRGHCWPSMWWWRRWRWRWRWWWSSRARTSPPLSHEEQVQKQLALSVKVRGQPEPHLWGSGPRRCW